MRRMMMMSEGLLLLLSLQALISISVGQNSTTTPRPTTTTTPPTTTTTSRLTTTTTPPTTTTTPPTTTTTSRPTTTTTPPTTTTTPPTTSNSLQFWCGNTLCPAGQDCINVNGTSLCTDPCQRYSVLNDSWRATNNNNNSDLHCDRDVSWQGWYRMFLGGISVQMPETCVEENMCGAHAPLWLTIPHPQLRDGVVLGGTCGKWYGGAGNKNCCDFRSNPIHVKACPGNYYVYKFVQPVTCYLAYCAESRGLSNSTTTNPPTTTTNPPTTTPRPTTIPTSQTTTTTSRPTTTPTPPTTTPTPPTTTPTPPTTTPTPPTTTTNPPTTTPRPTTTSATTTFSSVRYSVGKTRPPLSAPELVCGRDYMEVGLLNSQLEANGLDFTSVHLANRRCSTYQERNGTVWWRVEHREGSCGNTLTTNGSHAIFSNSLFVYPINSESLVQPLRIPFSCSYPLETEASLDVAIRPYLESEGAVTDHGDKAQASMSLFRDANYSEPYPAGPVTLPLGSTLHVGVSVQEMERERFVVVLEDCYATHSANPDDLQKYFLIQHKCPTDRHQVKVDESGFSLQARFSALLFLYQGDYRDIYLHCSISLCDQRTSSCSPMCSGRRVRSVAETVPLKPVTIGPITWDQTPE